MQLKKKSSELGMRTGTTARKGQGDKRDTMLHKRKKAFLRTPVLSLSSSSSPEISARRPVFGRPSRARRGRGRGRGRGRCRGTQACGPQPWYSIQDITLSRASKLNTFWNEWETVTLSRDKTPGESHLVKFAESRANFSKVTKMKW